MACTIEVMTSGLSPVVVLGMRQQQRPTAVGPLANPLNAHQDLCHGSRGGQRHRVGQDRENDFMVRSQQEIAEMATAT